MESSTVAKEGTTLAREGTTLAKEGTTLAKEGSAFASKGTTLAKERHGYEKLLNNSSVDTRSSSVPSQDFNFEMAKETDGSASNVHTEGKGPTA